VLLLRLTQKRFSATQYALLSSLMALTRALTGPLTGVLVAALGWRDFFILTVPAGLPALLLLQRFAPWGLRDPQFSTAASSAG
jgi:PAT family beta-lactamase induction signal transducer AmpG